MPNSSVLVYYKLSYKNVGTERGCCLKGNKVAYRNNHCEAALSKISAGDTPHEHHVIYLHMTHNSLLSKFSAWHQ